jgi:hypothetical protein
MPFFFPPPPVFVGGAQPYTPAKLDPGIPGQSVDRAPASYEGRVEPTLGETAALAQPSSWPFIFLGAAGGSGRQPYAPRTGPPSTLIVPDPPFRHYGRRPEWMAITATAAQPADWPFVFVGAAGGGGQQPYGPRTSPPSLLIVPDPPFRHAMRRAEWMATVAMIAQPASWPFVFINAQSRAPYAGPLLAPGTPGQSVDNPPFGEPDVWELAPIVRAWQPPDPWPTQANKLAPGIPGQSVDPPPVTVAHPEIVRAWQPADPAAILAKVLSPGIPGQSVDNPPPLKRPIVTFPVDVWAPTLPRNLSPGIPGQSVDNPPGLRPAPVYRPDDPWRSQSAPLFVQAAVVVAGGQTPYSAAWFVTVLLAWQPAAGGPVLPRLLNPSITAVAVNDPPFSQRAPLPGILRAWQPADPQPYPWTRPGFLFGQQVDPPPIGGPMVAGRAMITLAWQPADPAPTQARKLSPGIPGQSIDPPPPARPFVAFPVPSAPPPTLPRQLSPGIPGQSVDNPPRIMVRAQGSAAWELPAPSPTLPRRIVQAVAAAAGFIPNPALWLSTVLSTWQPAPWWLPQRLRQIVQPGNYFPPPGPPDTTAGPEVHRRPFQPGAGDRPVEAGARPRGAGTAALDRSDEAGARPRAYEPPANPRG